MKKTSKILIIIGIFIMIIGIIVGICSNESNPNLIDYSKIKEDKSLKIQNLKIEKLYRSCVFGFEVYRENLVSVNFDYYDFYLLDDDDNLIYIIDGITIGEGGFSPGEHVFSINSEVNYDISSTTNIVISFKGNKYKYNKDLTKDLKKLPIEE